MFELAKRYIDFKWSVIPVGKDKRPLIKWAEFQEKRATVDVLSSWMSNYTQMQLGIVTGQISNIIVVDIDDPQMDCSWLPKTLTARTGSGGFHYYYRYTTGYTNKARIKENIDIRADGGYVVVPPSENEKGKYEWIDKSPIAPFPIHLFEKKKQINYQTIKTEYIGYGQGQRNDQMARYTGHILAKIHPSEWETIAYPLIQEANTKNTPPLDDRELRSIFDSIINKEKGNTTERWYKEEAEKINIEVKNDYKDRYTWGTNGLDNNLAIIKRGNFIIIGAKRGQGKTSFTFDMACKNALLGHKVLYISLEMEEEKIRQDFARKYSGISVGEEYHYAIPQTKQDAYEKKIGEIKEIQNLYFRGMRRGKTVNWQSVVELINEFKDIDLIFIDNLDLIDDDSKTDTERQKNITKKIMGFTSEYQIPVILIHHHRKSTGKDFNTDELAGSGKIGDNADIILKIERNNDPEATYPDKYMSRIVQQKSRGYPLTSKIVYFVRGSFEDEAPFIEDNNQIKSFYETN